MIFFFLFNMHQLNNVLNNHDTQLDLIFLNSSFISVKSLGNSIVPLGPYHPVLVTEYILANSANYTCSKMPYPLRFQYS